MAINIHDPSVTGAMALADLAASLGLRVKDHDQFERDLKMGGVALGAIGRTVLVDYESWRAFLKRQADRFNEGQRITNPIAVAMQTPGGLEAYPDAPAPTVIKTGGAS